MIVGDNIYNGMTNGVGTYTILYNMNYVHLFRHNSQTPYHHWCQRPVRARGTGPRRRRKGKRECPYLTLTWSSSSSLSLSSPSPPSSSSGTRGGWSLQISAVVLVYVSCLVNTFRLSSGVTGFRRGILDVTTGESGVVGGSLQVAASSTAVAAV